VLNLSSFLTKIANLIFRSAWKLCEQFQICRLTLAVDPGVVESELEVIEKRAKFYLPMLKKINIRKHLNPVDYLLPYPIITFSNLNSVGETLLHHRPGVFNIDYRNYYADAWRWIDLLNFCSGRRKNFKFPNKQFKNYVQRIKDQGYKKSYIFGTGPSLEKAIEYDWSDGIRIVCNTIVRDVELWNKIQPHFIVAADALYHFSDSNFARSFREDLWKRLEQSLTYFVYPSQFDIIVRRDYSKFTDRLIPIPIGRSQSITIDLTESFQLPSLGNVLNLILLPLACTLTKDIFLWGFDGRAPGDKLFWSNSEKHSYPEFMQELVNDHPAFFEHYVPKSNPNLYVSQVHGDLLEELLQDAEKKGWNFTMMHHSWTHALDIRYRGEASRTG